MTHATRRTATRWGQIHAREYGPTAMAAGLPALVLVHGLVIAGEYLEPTARRCAAFARVLVPDLPGYGESDKPPFPLSLRELADALAEFMAANRVHGGSVLANSFGCQVVTDLAVRHPDCAGRLVLQGPTIDPTARTLVKQIGRLIVNSRRESPGLGFIMARDYARAGLRRIIATVKIALNDAMEERLPKIAVPTLVVRGERDPLVPARWADEVARLLPRGEVATIPNAAHTIVYTEPDALVSVVRPFLGLDGC